MLDINKVTDLVSEVAATEVMPRFQSLQDHEVSEKKGGDLVTVADVAAERVLTRRLSGLLPGSLVVGEEAVHDSPDLMEHLSDDGPVWTIDPVDGTGNFARGKPVFAVMVGLLKGGETVAGWIHDPVNARTAVAELGSGARLDGAVLPGNSASDLAEMVGTLHASSYASKEISSQVQQRRARLNTIKSLSCAGWEYLRLAQGEMQFSLFTRLMPWDHVPGTLIFSEVGGCALCLDGTPYRGGRYREAGLLMAPNRDSWKAIEQTLFAP